MLSIYFFLLLSFIKPRHYSPNRSVSSHLCLSKDEPLISKHRLWQFLRLAIGALIILERQRRDSSFCYRSLFWKQRICVQKLPRKRRSVNGNTLLEEVYWKIGSKILFILEIWAFFSTLFFFLGTFCIIYYATANNIRKFNSEASEL